MPFFGFKTAVVTKIWCESNLVWSIFVRPEADLSTGQSKIIGVQRPWQIKGGRELTRQSHLFVTPEMMSLRSCRISSYVNDRLMGCPNLQIMQFLTLAELNVCESFKYFTRELLRKYLEKIFVILKVRFHHDGSLSESRYFELFFSL